MTQLQVPKGENAPLTPTSQKSSPTKKIREKLGFMEKNEFFLSDAAMGVFIFFYKVFSFFFLPKLTLLSPQREIGSEHEKCNWTVFPAFATKRQGIGRGGIGVVPLNLKVFFLWVSVGFPLGFPVFEVFRFFSVPLNPVLFFGRHRRKTGFFRGVLEGRWFS